MVLDPAALPDPATLPTRRCGCWTRTPPASPPTSAARRAVGSGRRSPPPAPRPATAGPARARRRRHRARTWPRSTRSAVRIADGRRISARGRDARPRARWPAAWRMRVGRRRRDRRGGHPAGRPPTRAAAPRSPPPWPGEPSHAGTDLVFLSAGSDDIARVYLAGRLPPHRHRLHRRARRAHPLTGLTALTGLAAEVRSAGATGRRRRRRWRAAGVDRAQRGVPGAQRQPAPGLEHRRHPPGLPDHGRGPGAAHPVVRLDDGVGQPGLPQQRRAAWRRPRTPGRRPARGAAAWRGRRRRAAPPRPGRTGKPYARGSGRSSRTSCWTRSAGSVASSSVADRRGPARVPAAQQGELGLPAAPGGARRRRWPPSRCRPGWTRRRSRARPATRPRTGSPAPSISPPTGWSSGSRGARYQGMTARQAAQPELTTRGLRGEPAADRAVRCRRRRPPGRPRRCAGRRRPPAARPASTRTWRTATPVRISTRSPRPAISASCRSSRCTTTGVRSAGHRARGCTSQCPSGRRTPPSGSGVAIGGQAGAEAERLQRADAVGPEHHARSARRRTRSPRSSRVTCQPERASAPATARPPMPAPTTTAVRIGRRSAVPVGGPRARGVGPVGPRGRRIVPPARRRLGAEVGPAAASLGGSAVIRPGVVVGSAGGTTPVSC